MAAINGLGGLSSVDTLVSQALAVESKPLTRLDDNKKDYQRKLAVFTDFRSELTKLRTRVKSFLQVGSSDTLGTKRAESSNASLVTATASSSAEVGVNTFFVSRIASRDTALSDKINISKTTLAKEYNGTTQKFNIQVGNGEMKTISIEFDDKKESNESVMNRITNAINDANLGASANLVKVNKSNVRLSVISGETGSDSSLNFSEVNGGSFLAELGLLSSDGERETASNSKGGFINKDIENLDSLFTINGVEVTQSSNEVEGIVKGLTINLHKAHASDDQPDTITIANDSENLGEEIKGFIEDYNSALSYITSRSGVNTSTGTRGDFTGNYQINQLRFKIRDMVSRNIELSGNDEIDNLSDIGIEIGRDGTLSIADTELFDQQIQDNANEVRSLFTAEDSGIATKIENEITRFTRFGGVISDNERGIKNKLKNIDSQKKRFNDRLALREESLRRQFASLQKVLSQLNTQQSFLQKFNLTFQSNSFGNFGIQKFGPAA